MKNIFDQRPIDDNNFLEYDVSKLAKHSDNENLKTGLERLAHIREVLFVAQKINRLQNIGNKTSYTEALKWLKGESAINTWHHVPQIEKLDNAAEDVVNSFNTFTDHLHQNLQSEPVFAQIELALEVNPIARALPITKRVEKVLDQAKEKLEDSASKKEEVLTQNAATLKDNLRNEASSVQSTFNESLESQRRNAIDDINNIVAQASSQLRTAVALDDWAKHYDDDIAELQERLFGIKLNNSLIRNFKTLKTKINNLRSYGMGNLNLWSLAAKATYLLLRNTISFTFIIWSKLSSLAARRTYSFLVLVIISVAMVSLPLVEILGISKTNFFNTDNPLKWLSKISLWLPAVIIFSIGYSFTTKNYRIYSNMLDQYKHRRAVARTAQGIILNDSSAAHKEFRAAMTAAAAAALFEHKVTGHLSKKEVESLGLIDVIKNIK